MLETQRHDSRTSPGKARMLKPICNSELLLYKLQHIPSGRVESRAGSGSFVGSMLIPIWRAQATSSLSSPALSATRASRSP